MGTPGPRNAAGKQAHAYVAASKQQSSRPDGSIDLLPGDAAQSIRHALQDLI